MAREHDADGRVFAEEIVAEVGEQDDGQLALRSPGVGLYRGAPAPGTLVMPGAPIGQLEVLGRLATLRAPAGATGFVVQRPGDQYVARQPVGYHDLLLVLDPEAASGVIDSARAAEAEAAEAGLVLRSPSSGRFYGRPAPDKDAFVVVGDVVSMGQTVALLEVMKTFNRVQYGGAGLPERARVKRIVPANESDLEQGAVLLELEEV